MVAAFGFEGVAPGSGPWIVPNQGQFTADKIGPASGWLQAGFQSPSVTGNGLEVWVAIYGSGTNNNAVFAANQNCSAVTVGYSGNYNPTGTITGAPPRLFVSAQTTGNQPASPSVIANSGELVVACGADQMTGSGFGTPSGFTNRVDVARSGAGTVEATIADRTATVAGATGPITFPNAAATAATAGATATLIVQPAPVTAGSGALQVAPMPPELDLGPGYSLSVTALSTTNGSLVSGVNVSNFTVLLEDEGATTQALQTGPYMLVPGPNA